MPRYIDADEFKNGVMSVMTENSAKDGALPLQIGMMLCNFADDTPTADVQEVKHARWIDAEEGDIRCSACGHFTSEILGDFIEVDEETAKVTSAKVGSIMHVSKNPLYCSRCGAKMDLEGGDGE